MNFSRSHCLPYHIRHIVLIRRLIVCHIEGLSICLFFRCKQYAVDLMNSISHIPEGSLVVPRADKKIPAYSAFLFRILFSWFIWSISL